MAAAGAHASPKAGGAQYQIKRLGARRAWRSRSSIAIAAATALIAIAGGLTLASVGQRDGRAGPPRASAPGGAGPATSASPASGLPSVSPSARNGGNGATLEVVGVGCPGDGDDAVTPDNAPAAPAWMPAGGGWTGNGCDGSTLWTMDPGSKPAPSTLTWRFGPVAGASRCTLAVFVPTQNALGVSEYSVSVGPARTSRVIADVPVSQTAAAGQWLTLGTFPVSGSPLEITTGPVPGASGPGHHGAIAASAASARCVQASRP